MSSREELHDLKDFVDTNIFVYAASQESNRWIIPAIFAMVQK
jgi:hypothetical protein